MLLTTQNAEIVACILLVVIWFTFEIPQQQPQRFYSCTQKSKLNNVNEY